MMSCRIENLLATSAAYVKYGILLLTETQGKVAVFEPCDDLGLFLYVPFLSKLLRIEPVYAAKMFLAGIITVFFTITAFAFFKISKTYWAYGAVLLGLWKLSRPLLQLSDVYLASMLAFLGIPLVLLALEKKSKNIYWISFFITGLVAGFSNIVRGHAALPVFTFLLIILFFDSAFDVRKKIIAFVVCVVGFALPYGHLQYTIHQRNMFVEQSGEKVSVDYLDHPIWHNLYIGFGFLSNTYGITYDDACGEEHAIAAQPGLRKHTNTSIFNTKLYSDTIRKLVINLIKTDRYFVVITVFAKLGVIFFFFLLFLGWLGLLAAYIVPKPWYIESAFFCAAGVSIVPGVLTMPATAYLMGFITCTVLYTIYSLIWFFDHNGVQKMTVLYQWLRRKKKP